MGDLGLARAYREEALSLYRQSGVNSAELVWLQAGVAQVALAQGDLQQAQAHVASVLALLEVRGALQADWEPLRAYLNLLPGAAHRRRSTRSRRPGRGLPSVAGARGADSQRGHAPLVPGERPRKPGDHPRVGGGTDPRTELRVYTLRLDESATLTRQCLSRSLTDKECQRYLHLEVCPAQP